MGRPVRSKAPTAPSAARRRHPPRYEKKEDDSSAGQQSAKLFARIDSGGVGVITRRAMSESLRAMSIDLSALPNALDLLMRKFDVGGQPFGAVAFAAGGP